jgi:hypothetical protein
VTAPLTGAGLLHVLVDRLAATYGDGAHRGEIAAAREHYFTRAGKVFEDDAELYERRMGAFLEWYVVERRLPGGRTPVEDALASGAYDDAERGMLAALATSHRSLVDVAAVDGRHVLVEDLLGGARFEISERRSTVGFEVGGILEARVVRGRGEAIFGKTVLFHPRDARDSIIEVIDEAVAANVAREDIMFALARQHVRWHRLGHVGAARVYREALRFKPESAPTAP